jgi:phosphate transport system permease protein
VGETAPLVLTTQYNNDTNLNPFNGPMAMLPTFIFGYIRNMYDTSIQRGWGGCLVIMIMVGVLFVGARVANRKKK